jgi:tetratricopeptide (TPR) repeat protein
MLAIGVLWWTVSREAGYTISGHALVDLLVVLGAVAGAWRRGLPWQDGLLWMLLSRRLHYDALSSLGGFPHLVILSWVIVAFLLTMVNKEGSRALLVIAHASLTMDAGMVKPIGMGMTIGWETSALDLLLLSWILRTLFLPRIESLSAPQPPGKMAYGFFLAAIWLLHWHRTGPASVLTGRYILTASLLLTFCIRLGAFDLSARDAVEALAISGLPICLIALGMGLADASDLAVLWRKRFFAGGLHPNLFGAWSLAMCLILAVPGSLCWIPAEGRRVMRGFGLGVYALMLFGAGSRIMLGLMLLALLVGVVIAAGRWRWLIPLGGMAGGFVALRILQEASWMEWTHNERWYIWASAWQAVSASLWTGKGIFAYAFLPQTIPLDRALWVYDWNYPHTHHLFLEALLWGGVPLVVMLGYLLIARYRRAAEAGETLWIPLLALNVAGLADFVWFTPGQLALGLLLLYLPDNSPSRPAYAGRPRGSWRGVGLALGLLAGVGLAFLPDAHRLTQEAIAAYSARNKNWSEVFDQANRLAPWRIEGRLLRLLFAWSAGVTPTPKDRAIVADLRCQWPDYYLLAYLEGRLALLAGSPEEAASHFRRSLALEPRDVYGIRWGLLALSEDAQGRDPASAAWQACQRIPWGGPLLLDHPVRGPAFRTMVKNGLLATPPSDVFALLPALTVTDSLLRGGERIDPACLDSWLLPGMPHWMREYALGLRLTAAGLASPEATLAACARDWPEYGVSRLLACLWAADRYDRFDLITSAARRLAAIWNYRNKNDEDLESPFLLSRALIARKEPMEAARLAARLLPMDPGNPWLLERYGDALAAAGSMPEARATWQEALSALPAARLEPGFPAGPRLGLAQVGDQWTLFFERALRRFDSLAPAYHREQWNALADRLQRKIKG